jgi:anaerobic magnesium-protoporphyrin IX monomethyl ester cyclase
MQSSPVVIVNPPSPPGYVSNKDSMGGFGQLYPVGATLLPPLDLPYLAGYLADKGQPVEVLESLGHDLTPEHLAQRVAEISARGRTERTLVVVRTSAPTIDWDLSVCAMLKKAAPNVALALYGSVVPHVMKRLQREPALDYIIQGEPDETVDELASGRAEEEICGLTYRRGEEWVEGRPRPFVKDLDRLPFPKWELLPYQRYALPKSSATAPIPFLTMLTSRGCPFGCHYCPYPVGQGLNWRFRSPENVVDEIEHLVKDLGIQYILFRDPMFSLRKDRVVEICNEIRRRGLQLKWKCETRVDCLDEETLRAMALAGCDGVNFGVESAEVAIQANVGRKPIAQERFIETVAICRKLGIKTFGFFIIGLPGDTAQSILETIAFAIRLRPNWVQFTATSPFIGTKLRAWAVAEGLTPDDEFAYVNSHEAMIGNEHLTKEQVAAMLRFAQFFERYIINRGGVLKDENRKDVVYSAGRLLADVAARIVGRTVFTVGHTYLQRTCASSV